MTFAAAPLPIELPWESGDFGDFRVLSPIAEGGMGIVLRAQDRRDGRLVAVKAARSAHRADGAAIRRETAVLRRVDHPGIVRLLNDGVWDGIPWMAMELLEGKTLDHVIRSWWPGARRVSTTHTTDGECADDVWTAPVVRQAARARRLEQAASSPPATAAAGHLADVFAIMQQLCLAVGHLHNRGFVHRDLKPANVMVGDDGRITLFDFGLACAARELKLDRNRGSICIGTVEYASPEQICGASVDTRADIYSLGCILYELCTGQRPFDSDSSQEVMRMQLYTEPRLPSDLLADVPCTLEKLILQMMAKRPEARPATAVEVTRRLGRVASQLDPGTIEQLDVDFSRSAHGGGGR